MHVMMVERDDENCCSWRWLLLNYGPDDKVNIQTFSGCEMCNNTLYDCCTLLVSIYFQNTNGNVLQTAASAQTLSLINNIARIYVYIYMHTLNEYIGEI